MNGIINVSIIIVNYNTKELLQDCIKSIIEYTKDISYEIIVSDNNSNDGSVEMIEQLYPEVILIKNNKNLGFGAANNRGLAVAKGKYIFYLNSDTKLLNNAVKYFFDYYENNQDNNIGALGCNLLKPNGEIGPSYSSYASFNFKHDVLRFCYDYFLLLCFWRKNLSNKQKQFEYYTGDVDIIIGADLFLLNDSFAKFDEYFFLYHEESDLELQMAKANKRRILIDGPQIIHYQGGSNIEKNSKFDYFVSFSRIHDRLSRVKFYKKNGTKFQYKVMKFIVKCIFKFPTIKKYTKTYLSELNTI